MSVFLDRLHSVCSRHRSLLCVGLDPDPALMPVDDVFEFNKAIIDATHDLVCAYKPNIAFYEALGVPGLQALKRTVEHIRRVDPDAIILIDAKRGDIGNTSRAYARALFETWDCDAATVNAFGGRDGVQPFLDYAEKGVFVWCRSSNEGARDFQDLPTIVGRSEGEKTQPLYEAIAKAASSWNGAGNVGLVLAATYPEETRAVRSFCPGLPFLIPGVGRQGGPLEQAVRNGIGDDGGTIIVSSSRGILYASGDKDFADTARRAASELRGSINDILASEGKEWS